MNRFHAHLDICEQCREHPLNLCEVGAYFLGKAVDAGDDPVPPPVRPSIRITGPAPTNFGLHYLTGRRPPEPPHLQNIPIRTELGKQIRRAFIAGPPGSVLMMTDYNAIEMKLMEQFSKEFGLPETPTAPEKPLVCAECGCETNVSMEKPCSACGSIRMVLVSVIEDTFGENWRDAFKDPKK